MVEASPQSPQKRILRHSIYGLLILSIFVLFGWYLTSAGFREVVRNRLAREIEDAIGGQVEIRRIDWNLADLQIAIEGITVHGLEGPNDAPLAHVERVDANIRIVSLLGREWTFNSLIIQKPQIHLVVYPDGRTNQPTPHGRAGSAGSTSGSALDPLFKVAIRDFVIKNGELLVNQERTPLQIDARDVTANVGYLRSPECYDGTISIGKLDHTSPQYRPFSSAADFDFRLFRNALVLRSAHITSEGSQLSFSGRLDGFSAPRFAANYQLKLDLRQVGAIARNVSLQAGVLQINGNARSAGNDTTSSGTLQLTNGAWSSAGVHVSTVSGSATYRLDQDRLEVSKILANALGGQIVGQLNVVHWNAPPRTERELPLSASKSSHNIVAREQNAKGTFTLRGLAIDRIAGLFSTPQLPLSELHASGTSDGTAELTWVGSPRAAQLKLDVEGTPGPDGNDIVPVTAHLQGVYDFRRAEMQITQGELHTPHSHLTTAGRMGTDTTDLTLTASTTRLHEIQPLLVAHRAEHLPVELSGDLSFQGTLQGHTATPTIAGHLSLRDFDTVIQTNAAPAAEPELVKALRRGRKKFISPPPQNAGKPVRFHWDSFDGNISYGPENGAIHDGVLISGSQRIEVAGSVSLHNGSFGDDSLFHVNARVHDARVEDAQTLLGLNYPVSGKFNLEVEMTGTRADPKGHGTLSLSDGKAYGEPLDTLSTKIDFSGREARFTDVQITSAGAKAQGSGSIDVSTERFQFATQGSGVDLLRFPVLQTSKVKLTGVAGFTAKGTGTLSAPLIEGQVGIGNISLGGKREGDLEIHATTVGENLKLTAESHFATATLTADGNIHLRNEMDCDITAKFGNVDLQPFLIGVARGHSSIDGTVHLSGPLRNPEHLKARLEIPRYESQVETVVLRNAGSIVATYSDGTATLQSFRLVGDDTDLTSSGTAKLSGNRELQLRADGQLNLKLLQSFDPEIVSYGKTTIGVRVGGTMADPALRGRITIDHAGIAYVDMPNGLSDLNGTLVFNQDRLQVEKLTAHTGGGDLTIGGFISYGRNISFNLTATGKDVRIRYPEGVSANADADLRLAGTLQNATLTGDVVVNKFGLNPRFDFAYYLTRSKQLTIDAEPRLTAEQPALRCSRGFHAGITSADLPGEDNRRRGPAAAGNRPAPGCPGTDQHRRRRRDLQWNEISPGPRRHFVHQSHEDRTHARPGGIGPGERLRHLHRTARHHG